MEQQIITLVNERINTLFVEVKNILLQQENYSQKVDPQNLSHYFSFLEVAFKQPYNRLSSLSVFVTNGENISSDLMYPLAMLKEETKRTIHQKAVQAGMLVSGLDTSGIDPNFLSFITEKHLEDKKALKLSTV